MVSDTLLGAIIGVSGAIIGSLLTGLFGWLSTKQRIKAEDKRRQAEFYMENKVERLTAVHSRLIEVEQAFARTLVTIDSKKESEEYPQISNKEEIYSYITQYQFSITNATIYLDNSQAANLRKVADKFWRIYDQLDDDLNIDADMRDEIIDATFEGREILEEEISEPVRQLEES